MGLSSMSRTLGLLSLGIVAALPTVGYSAVLVDNSLILTAFSITPASGTLVVPSPPTGTAFAEAIDSLGGLDQDFHSASAGSVSSSAAVTLASANAAVGGGTMSADSHIAIPNIAASASATGRGRFFGYFEIVGSTTPVNVTFSATLSGSQTLLTNALGLQATGELIFSLNLPDVDSSPFLFANNLISIGPNSSGSGSINTTLSKSASLQPDTPYYINIEVDAESSGVSIVPEPSTWLLGALGIAALYVRRKR